MSATTPVIIAACRTAIGNFGGALSTVSAPKLGSATIQGLLEKTGIKGDQVDEVILGNVLQAGIGQNPARQASLSAGLPETVPAMTINKGNECTIRRHKKKFASRSKT